jgi:DNA-binding NarL/FixJ family response regulator
MIKVLISDDHAIVRKGIKQLLLEQWPCAQIGETSNAEELVQKAVLEDWNVVICDLSMPGRSGLDALKQIKKSSPQLPVLIMSMYPEDQYAVRVLKAGAAGYLSKDSIHEDLIKAIETVMRGKRFITPSIAESLVEAIHVNGEEQLHESLSDREFEVFKLLAQGQTVSQIAQQLSLSTTTISTYRSRILEKMRMRSNTDLARYGIEHHLI